jgi:hypothetical protein
VSGPAPEDSGAPRGPSRSNIAALIAVVVLIALGYWAFAAIQRQREIARCLDEGRRDCLQYIEQGK